SRKKLTSTTGYYLFSNRCFWSKKDSWANSQQYEQYGYKDKGII
ncbi:hypothetical protein HMPREF1347_01631, partial [Enterococcus faecium 504]